MPVSQTNTTYYEELLEGMNYPSSKAEIINHVQDKGAAQEIMDHFNAMPESTFNTSHDVLDNLGNIASLPHEGHPSNREGETTTGRTNIDPARMAESVDQ